MSSATKKTLGCARLVGVAMSCPLLAFQPQAATAQETKPTCAVYGDSPSMMYLPYKSDQEADARQLMVDMFDLVLPENVSEEVIKKAKKGTSNTRADHCY